MRCGGFFGVLGGFGAKGGLNFGGLGVGWFFGGGLGYVQLHAREARTVPKLRRRRIKALEKLYFLISAMICMFDLLLFEREGLGESPIKVLHHTLNAIELDYLQLY